MTHRIFGFALAVAAVLVAVAGSRPSPVAPEGVPASLVLAKRM